MPRFNSILGGPVGTRPQAQERIMAAATLPGVAVVINGSNQFAAAGAATNEKIYLVQDNYLVGKGVDDAWPAGERGVALEMLDDQIFYVRVPTGQNLGMNAKLTTNASGKFIAAATGNRILVITDEAFNNNTGSDQLVRARRAVGHLASA